MTELSDYRRLISDPQIQRMEEERRDLFKANTLLHGLLRNRDAEIELLRAALDEIKMLAKAKAGGTYLRIRELSNYEQAGDVK